MIAIRGGVEAFLARDADGGAIDPYEEVAVVDYEQVRREVATLSGGERTRLAFLALMLDAPNCLVLDEPTNHLDIDSIEVLEDALERFDGTVIAVSHDRYFLDRIADRIVLVADGEVRSFEGGWSANADVLAD